MESLTLDDCVNAMLTLLKLEPTEENIQICYNKLNKSIENIILK